MPEPLPVWIGKDEHGGIPRPARVDLRPTPSWRLEAVVATERPRSPAVSADGSSVVFIQDRDTSDLWLLDIDGGPPLRLTTGRDPQPYWEDTQPVFSRDGTQVAYADDGWVYVVPTSGGPPRKVVEAGSPAWIGSDRLVVSIERDRCDRLAVVTVAEAWPQRLARKHVDLETHGDEQGAIVSPDGSTVAYSFVPHSDYSRSEVRVADVVDGKVRALTGAPGIRDYVLDWSPNGTTLAVASESSGWFELHLFAVDGSEARQLTTAEADFVEARWHPDGTRLVATRGRAGRFDLVTVAVADGIVTDIAAGGVFGAPAWTADGRIIASYESPTEPPELRIISEGGEPVAIHSPAPLSISRAPHVVAHELTYTTFDGREIQAFLYRPATASTEHPAPAVVYPHGGPADCYGGEWDGHAQYFVDKGYAWFAINYRGSTGHGSDFERANHGVWGVDDTKDCLAAADYLRTVDWVDGDRLGIFGSSYGSYLALLAVTDDPDHRFRCAICKYGDCDALTTWAQADRAGGQMQMRIMGHPSANREDYIAASPVHRLDAVTAPILVAHGHTDRRVPFEQSTELVAELSRLGKTYEYVTYPTEGHGFLRVGPQLDFYRRLEGFLDWYLL
ncbi:S9 family peptidase [Gaiella sp.]|uniref:S9 family peptidase n=1 Tax=Gaiella sp. TaxID=2663207 RepID=UPI0032670420